MHAGWLCTVKRTHLRAGPRMQRPRRRPPRRRRSRAGCSSCTSFGTPAPLSAVSGCPVCRYISQLPTGSATAVAHWIRRWIYCIRRSPLSGQHWLIDDGTYAYVRVKAAVHAKGLRLTDGLKPMLKTTAAAAAAGLEPATQNTTKRQRTVCACGWRYVVSVVLMPCMAHLSMVTARLQPCTVGAGTEWMVHVNAVPCVRCS